MLKPLVEAVVALAVQPLEGHHLASVLAAIRVRD
jgi:hypothetical protein